MLIQICVAIWLGPKRVKSSMKFPHDLYVDGHMITASQMPYYFSSAFHLVAHNCYFCRLHNDIALESPS